jgi:hypothetical protein
VREDSPTKQTGARFGTDWRAGLPHEASTKQDSSDDFRTGSESRYGDLQCPLHVLSSGKEHPTLV